MEPERREEKEEEEDFFERKRERTAGAISTRWPSGHGRERALKAAGRPPPRPPSRGPPFLQPLIPFQRNPRFFSFFHRNPKLLPPGARRPQDLHGESVQQLRRVDDRPPLAGGERVLQRRVPRRPIPEARALRLAQDGRRLDEVQRTVRLARRGSASSSRLRELARAGSGLDRGARRESHRRTAPPAARRDPGRDRLAEGRMQGRGGREVAVRSHAPHVPRVIARARRRRARRASSPRTARPARRHPPSR